MGYFKNTGKLSEMEKQLSDKAKKTYLTPQEFEAKGDGIVDDSISFRNALVSDVKFLLTPKGTYLFNNDFIVNNKDIYIMGEHRGHTILKNGVNKEKYSSTIDLKNSENTTISNITLDGNYAIVPGDIYQGIANLRIEKSNNTTIRDVNFLNNKFVACMIADSQNTTFDNCDFTNVDSGINGQEGTGLTDGVRISNCTFDGHSNSEPIAIPLAKNINIEHCKMLNKTAGHAMAFDGSQNIYVNDIYTYNCGNGVYLTSRNDERTKNVTIQNSIFESSLFGNRIMHSDNVLFENCTFIDGITTMVDCTNITFSNCKFISKNKECMVAFSESTSDNIKFIQCTFDNTAKTNWVDSFLVVYDDVVTTNLLFEECKFIDCIIYHKAFPTGSSIISRNNEDKNGKIMSLVEGSSKNDNNKLLRIVGTEEPWDGFQDVGVMFLYSSPTTHIGAINMVAGYAWWDSWDTGFNVGENMNLLLSNNIIVKALNSGTTAAGTEPLTITSANTESNPFTDANGIRWTYLGTPCNFVNFGAISL